MTDNSGDKLMKHRGHLTEVALMPYGRHKHTKI